MHSFSSSSPSHLPIDFSWQCMSEGNPGISSALQFQVIRVLLGGGSLSAGGKQHCSSYWHCCLGTMPFTLTQCCIIIGFDNCAIKLEGSSYLSGISRMLYTVYCHTLYTCILSDGECCHSKWNFKMFVAPIMVGWLYSSSPSPGWALGYNYNHILHDYMYIIV